MSDSLLGVSEAGNAPERSTRAKLPSGRTAEAAFRADAALAKPEIYEATEETMM